MMYIDQAPLGGNLVNIIKKSASLSSVAEQQSPTTESSAPLTKDLNCKDEAIIRKTTINGGHIIPNGKHQNIAQTLNNICQLIKTTNSKSQVADKEEEEVEDKSGYVLYDIEPEPEESLTKLKEQIHAADVNAEQNLTNGFKSFGEAPTSIKLKTTAHPVDAATISNKRTRETYEEEDDFEEFIVQIKPVPKLSPNQKAKSLTKPRRPLPAAIPIADFIAKSEKRVLNKYLFRPESAYEPDDPEDTDYRFVQSSPTDESLEYRASQMGIELLSGIWNNIFHRKSKTNTIEQDSTAANSKRKRSFGFSQPKAAPPQIKYRRVENSFPKIITRPLNDDLENFQAFQQRPTNKTRSAAPPPAFAFSNNIEMSQRGDSSVSQRRSLFDCPQKKIVRNTSYADIEFSDDEDDDAQTRRTQHTLGSLAPKNAYGGDMQHQPKVRNIPIQMDQSRSPMYMQPFANTNFMESMRQPTYADILKQPTSYGSGHLLGRHAGSSNNSSGDGASSSRFCNVLGKNSSRINAKTIGGSILRQERAKMDHENYKQLLDTLSSRFNHHQSPLLNLASNLSSKKKTHALHAKIRPPLHAHRAPLSSTINIDVDEDNENSSDEVVVTGITHLSARPVKSSKRVSAAATSVIIDDDDDDDEISEIIDLADDDEEKVRRKTANDIEVIDLDAKENNFGDLPYVEPVNTFREFFQTSSLKDNWLQNFNSKWDKKDKVRKEEVGKAVEITENITSERVAYETDLRARLQNFYIVDPELLGVDDFEKPEVEEVPEFPELNQARIKAAICGPPDQVLVEKFNLRITRRDIHTLLGLNWLNDEVINFYMSMITERSEKKHETHGYPKVYAMNTFFLQRVLQSGHGGVKRWTRKVDIFDKDIIPVPVHVGGVHWCMAIIHLKNRWIRYYDSMGSPNPNVLKALEQYLKDESLDKRKQPFDTSGFVIESVADVPRQQNGSDCGVFSCMFAEYTARKKPITFEQKHMEYFRHKMILEIVQGELLL